jgi:PKHD-type hydroxylase
MMLHIPGVLSAEQVAQMRKQLRDTDWVDGRASVGPQGAQVKRNRQLAEGSPLALELGQTISAALMVHPLFFSSVLPLRILAPYFNSYAGGELVVVDAYGTHEVKLPAGDAIIYPSGSVHEVLPVTSGERIASFLWTQSMVREDAKRALLFELDTNIQKLRAAHGESEATVGLTGHYHNLLRMWADV